LLAWGFPYCTVSCTVVECAPLPLLAVTVSVYVWVDGAIDQPPAQPIRVTALPSEARPAISNKSLPRNALRQRRKGSRKIKARTGVDNGQKSGRAVAAEAAVWTVNVDVPFPEPGVRVGGEKVPVAPVGIPVALSVTMLLKLPPADATVTVY